MALTRTLLANHWISASVALEAIERYVSARVSLSRLALDAGLLKMGPLLHILDEQLGESSVGDGCRFGEIAVELGYLDELQVEALNAAQTEVSPSFEEILNDLGAFDGVAGRRAEVRVPGETESRAKNSRRAVVSAATPSR